MLAMDIGQDLTDLLERRKCRELSAHDHASARRALLCENLTSDYQVGARSRLDPRVPQRTIDFRMTRNVELRLYDHPGATGADHLGAATLAEQQTDRVHDDRLAGTRLARQHIETGTRLDGDLFEDCEVRNLEEGEHNLLEKEDQIEIVLNPLRCYHPFFNAVKVRSCPRVIWGTSR